MKIILEELTHQKKALEKINENFLGVDLASSSEFSNPLIKSRYQKNTNIDVKMETGTGKTYVYSRMMYEWHKKFGIFKFVIVVPSPAIKEGTKSFLESSYAKEHFQGPYENVSIELNMINAGDFNTKSGRKNFPPQLSNFVESSSLNTNQIQVLIINAGMLNSKNMTRNDYDQTLLSDYSSPIDALKATKPIVIIDEPHRFPRDKKNFQAIEKLEPQMIVRFGATFPDVKQGTGKKAVYVKDYFRGKPQFELNAVDRDRKSVV